MGDFPHKLLHAYLTDLHLGNMQLVGESEKTLKKNMILNGISSVDEMIYRDKYQAARKRR